MYRITRLLGLAAALVLLLSGCAESPSAPGDSLPLNADLVAVDDYGFTWGGGTGPRCATGPGTCFGSGLGGSRSYLGGLVQDAYAKLLAEQGKEPADAAFANLWQLHQDAFALRKSGNQDAFTAAMAAAHTESVRIVVVVLGVGSVGTVVELASKQVAQLQQLIAEKAAAGAVVTRLEYAAARAAAYLGTAQAALAAGDFTLALDHGSRALQVATLGGGQNGQGAGTAGGQQRRRGR